MLAAGKADQSKSIPWVFGVFFSTSSGDIMILVISRRRRGREQVGEEETGANRRVPRFRLLPEREPDAARFDRPRGESARRSACPSMFVSVCACA
jgi:hypothetical protein